MRMEAEMKIQPWFSIAVHERAKQLFNERKTRPNCTCGWPSSDSRNPHAPDCELEKVWLNCESDALDEYYENPDAGT